MKQIFRSILFFIILLFISVFSYAGLSSPEHIARMKKYDVSFYWLDLTIQNENSDISGNALTRATCIVSSLDVFSLDLASSLFVDSVLVSVEGGDFISAAFNHEGQELNVLLGSPLLQGEKIEVRVFYSGAPVVSNMTNNSGFFKGALGKFSANPPYNSYSWWPCKQDLTDLADSSWFFITTKAEDRGVANGLLDNVVNLGANKRWEWKSKYPINFYLIAFVITSFEEVVDYWHPEGRSDSLMLTYYGYVPTEAKNILQVFSDKFGLYPFYEEKLGFAKVNFSGGMENQTIIVSNGTVDVHEMAHQWFGDRVACASWRDIMLSEGFATWAESVYSEFTATTPEAANIARKSHFMDITSLTSVYGNAMDTSQLTSVFGNPNIYYKKAAMVINTLRYHINNDALFFQGIKNYIEQNGGNAVTAQVLKQVMEEISGLDLTDFFNQWYYKGGAPSFKVVWNTVGNEVLMQVTQTTNNPNTPLFKTPVDVKILRAEGDTIVRLNINTNLSMHSFYFPGTITGLEVDPNQWLTNIPGAVIFNAELSVDQEGEMYGDNYILSPNPTRDYVILQSPSHEIVRVKIYDSLGKLCYSNESYRFNEQIRVGHLPIGTYFLHLEEKQKKSVSKLLVN